MIVAGNRRNRYLTWNIHLRNPMTLQTRGRFDPHHGRPAILEDVQHIEVRMRDDFHDSFRTPGCTGYRGQSQPLIDLCAHRVIEPRYDPWHAEDVAGDPRRHDVRIV